MRGAPPQTQMLEAKRQGEAAGDLIASQMGWSGGAPFDHTNCRFAYSQKHGDMSLLPRA